jgi:hypothetical protein
MNNATREELLERQKQMQKQEDASKSLFMRGARAVAEKVCRQT